MSRVYVNKPSGRGKELFGLVLVLVLAGLACGIVWWMVKGSPWKTSGGDGGPAPEAGESYNAEQPGRDAAPTPPPAAAERTGGDKDVGTYFNPSKAEMRQLWEIVRTSPHITDNKLYSRVMYNVDFEYLPDDSRVNAFATMAHSNTLGEGDKPAMRLLGGYVRVSRVFALACAAQSSGAVNAMPRIVEMWRNIRAGLSAQDMEAVIRESGLSAVVDKPEVLAKAKSISSGMILATLAHEAGHLALGHVYRGKPTSGNVVSQNQEREADSFSSSIISESPFGEYMLFGDLLFYAIDAKVGGGGGSHPYSEERFQNLVKSNPVLSVLALELSKPAKNPKDTTP